MQPVKKVTDTIAASIAKQIEQLKKNIAKLKIENEALEQDFAKVKQDDSLFSQYKMQFEINLKTIGHWEVTLAKLISKDEAETKVRVCDKRRPSEKDTKYEVESKLRAATNSLGFFWGAPKVDYVDFNYFFEQAIGAKKNSLITQLLDIAAQLNENIQTSSAVITALRIEEEKAKRELTNTTSQLDIANKNLSKTYQDNKGTEVSSVIIEAFAILIQEHNNLLVQESVCKIACATASSKLESAENQLKVQQEQLAIIEAEIAQYTPSPTAAKTFS